MKLMIGVCLLSLFVFLFNISRVEAKLVDEREMDSLFPPQFSDWKLLSPIRSFDRRNIFSYMNGAGEFYLAYDFTNISVGEYKQEKEYPITVEIYRMSSSEDAFGVFNHDLDGERLDLGQGAIYAKGFFKGWKNNVFIRIVALQENPKTREFILGVAKEILNQISGNGPQPQLINKLPKSKITQTDVSYFHKNISLNNLYFLATTNILQLSEETNAILATYPLQKSKARLIMVEYPNASAAKKAFLSFNKAYFPEHSPPTGEEVIQRVEKEQLVGVKLVSRYLYLIFEVLDDNFIKEVFRLTE